MVKVYNDEYDYHIIETLYRNWRLRYIQIKNSIEEKINKKLSFDTLNYHIKKLKENEYIESLTIEGKRGKKRYYCLTAQTKQDIRLGLMIINHNSNANSIFSKYQNNKPIVYFLTICIIATKGMFLTVNSTNLGYGISAKDISEYYGGVYMDLVI